MSDFILADCNNFFVSCERLLNPKLEGIPVIVLSNNDGCVVARSQEAKAMGIKMGHPYFQIKDLCDACQVAIYSSNYRLYSDLSKRVMNILSGAAPEMEIYSIDEAFLKYPDSLNPETLFFEAVELRKKIKKWVGIPVSLGIAPTKTLAKIANDIAKKNRSQGVFDLRSQKVQGEVLRDFPIEDVWGIGTRLSEYLKGKGVRTAEEFRGKEPLQVRKWMGVTGERMVWELRGVSCLGIEEAKPKKSIITSRSFGRFLTDKKILEEALSSFITLAAVRLRAQKSSANAICVFLESILDSKWGSRRHYSLAKAFPFPTSDTPQMISKGKAILSEIFIEKERYKKCGVILLDLISDKLIIPDLFVGGMAPKRKAFMQVVDALNARFKKNSLFFGAVGLSSWKMGSDKRSAYNATEWDQLPIAKA